ncbi:hypothetical protein [Streptomyces sp. NPDC059761]|uniref:hypothetical protein n=1 Tax=Streptomyces sp. NPDC059761 TaxID=3346937 RepID=UPI00364CF592
MPSTAFARPKPRLKSEQMSRTPVDEHYTLSFEAAAELLGLSMKQMQVLVRYSKRNAATGIPGPLTLTDNGHSVQLQSLFDYRRLSARFPSV